MMPDGGGRKEENGGEDDGVLFMSLKEFALPLAVGRLQDMNGK